MSGRWLICAVSCVACAPTYRAELVANVRGAFSVAQGPTLSVQVPIDHRGSFRRLKWTLALPRALELDYAVTCSGASLAHGREGETYESYRQRRLAELSQQRAANARAIGGLVGAVVPVPKAEVGAAGARATVDPGQATAQAALEVLPPAQLPAGDVGARTIQRELDISAAQPGHCVLSFESKQPGQDLTGVILDATVVRLTDVDAEQRAQALARRQADDRAGRDLRARLLSRLVALARPWARWDATGAGGAVAPHREPAQAHVQTAAPAAADGQSESRIAALRLRKRVLSRLEALGANPLWRWSQELARAQAAEEQRRRVQWQREQVAARAHLETQTALAARRAVLRILVRAGADPGLRARLADQDRRRRDEAQRQGDAARAEAEARRQREALEAAARAQREAWEASQRAHLEEVAAYSIRSRVLAVLQSLGADPGFRRRANERQIREWEAEVQGRQQAQREADALRTREMTAAFTMRQAVRARLIALGADPELRARLQLQLQLWQEQQQRGAGPSQTAASVPSVDTHAGPLPTAVVPASEPRSTVVAQPPPPPVAPIETPPAPPYPGAVWISGRFTWTGTAWVWVSGRYETSPAAALQVPNGVDVHVDLGAASLDIGGKAATRPTPPPTPPRHGSDR